MLKSRTLNPLRILSRTLGRSKRVSYLHKVPWKLIFKPSLGPLNIQRRPDEPLSKARPPPRKLKPYLKTLNALFFF